MCSNVFRLSFSLVAISHFFSFIKTNPPPSPVTNPGTCARAYPLQQLGSCDWTLMDNADSQDDVGMDVNLF